MFYCRAPRTFSDSTSGILLESLVLSGDSTDRHASTILYFQKPEFHALRLVQCSFQLFQVNKRSWPCLDIRSADSCNTIETICGLLEWHCETNSFRPSGLLFVLSDGSVHHCESCHRLIQFLGGELKRSWRNTEPKTFFSIIVIIVYFVSICIIVGECMFQVFPAGYLIRFCRPTSSENRWSQTGIRPIETVVLCPFTKVELFSIGISSTVLVNGLF